ncbi:MAG: hypothetical protein RIC16_16115 [Rhodospirillales bacterium]
MAMTIDNRIEFGAAGTASHALADAPTLSDRVVWTLDFVRRTLREIRAGQRISPARAHQLFAQASEATGIRF